MSKHQQFTQFTDEAATHLAALRIPRILTTARWLSNYAYAEKPNECTPLLPRMPVSSLREKYGSCREIIHYGVNSTVRIHSAQSPNNPHVRHAYAVKVFRPSSRPWAINRQYFEQALSTAVRHPNLLRTIDTVYNSRNELCLVMDYCEGGSLYALLTRSDGGIDRARADCYLKQILRAISFLHAHALAHRDVRLENILLTASDAVKVADFGSAEWLDGGCCCEDNDEEVRIISGESDTPPPPRPHDAAPYLPPEAYADPARGARPADIWAVGMVYVVMRCGRFPWRKADDHEDGRYSEYLHGRRAEEEYAAIEALGEERCRNVVYAMLDPNAARRITASEALRSEWLMECSA